MKTIRKIILIIVMIGFTGANSQTENSFSKWSGKTNLMIGFFHVGGYGKESPIFYLEQHFDYQLNSKFSIGGGLGISLYPALLTTPLFIHGKYHFKIKSIHSYIHQSFGYNIRTAAFTFKSKRYLGSFGMNIRLTKNTFLAPELGYSFIWDKYGGASLSTLFGLGIKYRIN